MGEHDDTCDDKGKQKPQLQKLLGSDSGGARAAATGGDGSANNEHQQQADATSLLLPAAVSNDCSPGHLTKDSSGHVFAEGKQGFLESVVAAVTLGLVRKRVCATVYVEMCGFTGTACRLLAVHVGSTAVAL